MCVAVVGELVVGGRELLKALEGDGVEVSAEFRVLRENHSSPRHERVDQRLLPHRSIECGVGRVLDLDLDCWKREREREIWEQFGFWWCHAFALVIQNSKSFSLSHTLFVERERKRQGKMESRV